MSGFVQHNEIHIGPEHLEPEVSNSGYVSKKRTSFITFACIFISIGSLFFGFVFLSSNVNKKFEDNTEYINSLVDEVGQLKQERFMLSEQITSQETVLQTIENDFSKLQSVIGSKDMHDSDFEKLFADSSLHLSEASALNFDLSKQVDLSSVPTNDGTFDVLILGTNGALSDTIMVASVNVKKQKVSLFSVPRDLYINGRRINEYYTYYGANQMERMVEMVTGLEIDNYVQVDLKGFTEIVDVLGGIDVKVEKAIRDGLYPNKKGGYSPYSIAVGNYHMTGEEALKYARSRKSTSDFDRAERQQVIVKAVRDKIMQLDLVMDIKSLTKMFQALMVHTKTDVSLFDAIGYYQDYKDFSVNSGLVFSTSNYLYSQINQNGAYMLLPKSGNYNDMHKAIFDLVN